MAHECPECWQVCYCGGDLDDILLRIKSNSRFAPTILLTPRWIVGLSRGSATNRPVGPLTLSTRPNWQLDWIIFGGESGHNRRPCERDWADSLRKECAERGTKFFVKQMSAKTPSKGKQLIPADLLIHEFPRREDSQ